METKSLNSRTRRRLRLKMDCVITGPINKTSGYLLNITEHGACIQLGKDVKLLKGDNIKIELNNSGCLFGQIAWQRSNLAGVMLEVNTNSYALTLSIIQSST